MLQRIGTALLVWFALFDLLHDWRGARWLPAQLRGLGGVVGIWAAVRLARAGGAGLVSLLLTFPLALSLQLALATLRNRHLNPRDLLAEGTTATRTLTRVDIPVRHGTTPALHLVPPQGAQAVVCVAHGSGSDKYFYTWETSAMLLARGFAVLLIDLDGHGESDRPQAYPHTAESLSDVLLWLRSRYARVGVIGKSLGGCVATHAAAHGASLDALVVIGSPPALQLTRAQVRREARGLLRYAILRQLRYGSVVQLVRAWTTTPKQRTLIATEDLIARLDLCGSLHHIGHSPTRLPVLLIYGTADALVPPAAVDQVDAAKPTWAVLYRLKRGTHLSTMIDPRTLRLVGAWLTLKLHPTTPSEYS